VTITLNPCVDRSFSVAQLVPDRKLASTDLRDDPGGGGINVARVIARLGGDVRALWSSGGDMGRRLARRLERERLAHAPISIEGDTRANLIVTDASTGEQYRFGMPGPTLTEAARNEWIEQLRRLPSSTRYAVFSGSMPGETPVAWFAELLRATPSGIRVVVDAKRDALRQALAVGVYLIKPNLHELEEIVGRELEDDDDIARAARELVDSNGAEVVVVSLGRGGAMLVTADARERFTSPAVPVRSKVGAGDSMVGGLVAALDQDSSLVDAVCRGVAAGAAAVITPGTELCRREDVERLSSRVGREEHV
jgi:6-phosphofructokinase 2